MSIDSSSSNNTKRTQLYVSRLWLDDLHHGLLWEQCHKVTTYIEPVQHQRGHGHHFRQKYNGQHDILEFGLLANSEQSLQMTLGIGQDIQLKIWHRFYRIMMILCQCSIALLYVVKFFLFRYGASLTKTNSRQLLKQQTMSSPAYPRPCPLEMKSGVWRALPVPRQWSGVPIYRTELENSLPTEEPGSHWRLGFF
jgi:hypothetical protein